MPIFQGTAKNRFTSFNPTESGGSLTTGLAKALGSVSSFVKGKAFIDSFVEDGSVDMPGLQTNDSRYTNLKKPSRRVQLVQQPKATILVKKKQFASLRTNYEVKYLDSDEKLFLKCIKTLLKRKCDEIAFYESLISFNSIYESGGFLNIDRLVDSVSEGFLGILIDTIGVSGISDIVSNFAADTILSNGGVVGLPAGEKENLAKNLDFLGDLYRLKQKNELAKASAYTRWVEAPYASDTTGIGPGTGTIELNLVSSIRTTTSVSSSAGNCNLDIEDPYQLMLITDADIEIAVRNVTSLTSGMAAVAGPNASIKALLAQSLDIRLTESRKRRKQPAIVFTFEDGDPVFEITEIQEIPGEDVLDELGNLTGMRTAPISFPTSAIEQKDYFRFKQAGVCPEEIGLINQILKTLRDYNSDMQLSADVFANLNVDTSVLRQRMRRDFLGQYLIQPMDQISVFMNSNATNMSTFGDGVGNLDASISSEKQAISLGMIEQERAEIAPSIPLFLYGAIRNRKIYRSDGNCVFTGLADVLSDEYSASNGKFSLGVSCKDMTEYLQLGRFTFKPGLNNTFGLVHDPLTPFDLNAAIDPATGLVDGSNGLQLLSQNKLRLPYLSTYYGPNAGRKVGTEAGLITDKEETFVLNHTPGLIYKWKEGIMTATPSAPGPEILRGISGSKLGGQFGGFSAVESPFAGLDAANIASILICGQPYDYTTFLQGIKSFGGFSPDATNGTRHFFNALFDATGRMAKFYGDFIPAKDASLSKDAVIAAAEITRTIEGLNGSIQKLLSERAKLQSQRIVVAKDPSASAVLATRISNLNTQIAGLSGRVTDSLRAVPSGIDIALEGNSVIFSNSTEQKGADAQLSYKIRRKPEDVRLNVDSNYFVVSSKYDASAVVQAFRAAALGQKMDLFSADYKTPYEIIQSACSALSLEFFADNNGNLILRPPQYNRIPMSLMMDLIRSRGDNGGSILPPFLLNIMRGREQNIKDQILDNELQIAKAIQSLGFASIRIDGASDVIVPLIRIEGVSAVLDDNLLLAEIQRTGSASSRRTSSFGPGDRLSLVTDTELLTAPKVESDELARLQETILAIYLRNGKILSANLILEADGEAEEILNKIRTPTGSLTVNSIVTKLGVLYSNRSALIRSLTDVLLRGEDAGASPSVGATLSGFAASLSPMLASNLMMGGDSLDKELFSISPLLRELVEDDINNADGPGSAARFIIGDEVIVASNMQHRAPDFNQIKVAGTRNLIGSEDGQIGELPDVVAEATDFDSWRQYGVRTSQDRRRPDFTSSDNQCAPYAVSELLRQRQQVHTGSITVVGNEWYRAGDNVYVQHRGLMYYVTSVSHSLDIGSADFKTTLSLSYGRPLGEYIPTPIDIAGTVLLKNTRKMAQYRTVRKPLSEQSTVITLGTASFPNYEGLKSAVKEMGALSPGRKMNQLISDNDSAIRSAVARTVAKFAVSQGNGYIEIRGYYAGTADLANAGAFSFDEYVSTKRVADVAAMAVHSAFCQILTELNSSTDLLGLNSVGNTVRMETYDISADIPENQRRYLPIPSEDAWAMPVDLQIKGGDLFNAPQIVQLPVNAVDIVYVVEKLTGNTKAPK